MRLILFPGSFCSRSQAFPKKRLIQGGRRSVSGCLLAQTLEGSITGVWHWCWWTVEQKVMSVEGSETETQSHVTLRAPYMASGTLAASMGSLSSRLYGFVLGLEARDRRRRTKKGLFQPEMSVNQLMEPSVEVLDNLLAWAITHQWSDVTHGFTPNGKYNKSPGKEDKKIKHSISLS